MYHEVVARTLMLMSYANCLGASLSGMTSSCFHISPTCNCMCRGDSDTYLNISGLASSYKNIIQIYSVSSISPLDFL